jgi:transposase
MIFACCLKQYLDFSSRRSQSDIKLAEQLGYIDHTPHFNTVLKYLRKPEMKKILTKLIEVSALPLKEIEEDFALDATGFSTAMYGQWLTKRNVYKESRTFKKVHCMCGIKTNIITYIEVTDGNVHDTVMFDSLVKNTARNFNMREVSADKGYSNEKNLQLVAKHGAIPYIVFKKNSRISQDKMVIWRIMFRYFKDHKEEFMEHYHKRNNVETVFSMVKRKFGSHVRAKDSIAQENEVLCKSLCHNIVVLVHEIFELGIKIVFSELIS